MTTKSNTQEAKPKRVYNRRTVSNVSKMPAFAKRRVGRPHKIKVSTEPVPVKMGFDDRALWPSQQAKPEATYTRAQVVTTVAIAVLAVSLIWSIVTR